MLSKLMLRLFVVGIVGLVAFQVNTVYAKKKQLTMGTTSSSSSHYSYFVSVAQEINKRVPGIQITAVESGAARENANRIVSDVFDLGLSDTITSYVAYEGVGNWEGKEHKDFRWLWTYIRAPFVFFVRDDSGVKNIQDLDGRKFAPAQVGSSASEVVQNVFKALDIEPDYHRGSYSDGVDAVKNKQIVGMAKPSAGLDSPDSAIMQVQSTTPVRILSLSEEDLAKLHSKYPHYQKMTLEPNVYDNQDSAVTTIGFAAGCITDKSAISEKMAYNMVKAVINSQKEVANAYPAVKNIDYFDITMDTVNIPLHAGAVKYYKEKGIDIPENLIPPEYQN